MQPKNVRLPTFVSQLRELVDKQQKDVGRALVGTGPHTLSPAMWKLTATMKWYTQMGELERAKYIMRFSRLQLRTRKCATFKCNTAEVADIKPQERSEESIVETAVGPARYKEIYSEGYCRTCDMRSFDIGIHLHASTVSIERLHCITTKQN